MTTVTIINIIVIWALCIFIAGCMITAGVIRQSEPDFKDGVHGRNVSDNTAGVLFILFVIISPILAAISTILVCSDMLRNGWMYSKRYKLGEKEVGDE